MARFTRFAKIAPLALLGLLGFTADRRVAASAATDDNDELVAGSEFQGFPDKDSHSGVFCDVIAPGSNSLVQTAQYRIVVPASQTSLRLAIFDANSAGLWDQNASKGNGTVVAPDGSVIGYDLASEGPTAPEFPAVPAPFQLGDSETVAPRAGAVVFTNAVDGRWEFLYDGPHQADALLANGDHQYLLSVKYLVPVTSAINGFKLAANGFVGQAPRGGQVLIGGFIGGVVDSRALHFTLGSVAEERSISRDHYPEAIKARAALSTYNASLTDGPSFQPAVRFTESDPFVNNYNGTFDLRLRLVPPTGVSWTKYLETLIVDEGDADDIDDLSGVGPDGLPSPTNRGIPPDDGGIYTDLNNVTHNNIDYALPFDPASPTYPGRAAGSAYLELIDPNGVVRVKLDDLSGNVSQESGTGFDFERIPVPADGVPGDWTVRIHQLDARNSWFLRSNAQFVPVSQHLCGRVYVDKECDGTDNDGTDPAIADVVVVIHRTDTPAADLEVKTDATGNWCLDPIVPGTYETSVKPGQDAKLVNLAPKTVQPVTREVTRGVSVNDVKIGYCQKNCECDADRRLHSVTLTGSVWLADPYTKNFDVYVRLDRADKGCCQGDIVDLACVAYTGAFPGAKTGANGVVTVTNVEVVNGYANVTVVLTADAPMLAGGFFDGAFRIETTVNGVGEAACGRLDCDTIAVGATFPKDWKPLWCGDLPDFKVTAKLAFTCWPDKPCTEGCVKGKSWWRVVNKYGTCDATKVAWPTPADEDASQICGKSWLWILKQSAQCDSWTALAQQYVTAMLNHDSGACLPKSVRLALDEAIQLLRSDCETRKLCGLDDERAWRLAKQIEAYNLGLVGPRKCIGEVPCCPPPPPVCKPPPVVCTPPAPPVCKPPATPACEPKDKSKDDSDKDGKSRGEKDKSAKSKVCKVVLKLGC